MRTTYLMAVLGGVAALVLGACTSSVTGPSGAASPGAAAATTRPPSNYDWLSIGNVRRELAQMTSTPEFAASRFQVVATLHEGLTDIIVLSLDGGKVPYLTNAEERGFYSTLDGLAKTGIVMNALPIGESVSGLTNLPFGLVPSQYTIHYVLMLPKQDGYLIGRAPSNVLGRGLAVTSLFDTTTLSLLDDQGSRAWDLLTAATEACQSSVHAQPTVATISRLQAALKSAGRHPPQDLLRLASAYRDLGQELACNGLGDVIISRQGHTSYRSYIRLHPAEELFTPDQVLGLGWVVSRYLYESVHN